MWIKTQAKYLSTAYGNRCLPRKPRRDSSWNQKDMKIPCRYRPLYEPTENEVTKQFCHLF